MSGPGPINTNGWRVERLERDIGALQGRVMTLERDLAVHLQHAQDEFAIARAHRAAIEAKVDATGLETRAAVRRVTVWSRSAMAAFIAMLISAIGTMVVLIANSGG